MPMSIVGEWPTDGQNEVPGDNSGIEPALWALKMTGGQQDWVGVPGTER